MHTNPSTIETLVATLGKTPKKLAKREVLVSPGDEPSSAYFIVSGRVRQIDIRSNGSEVMVNMYGPGSLLSLPWILFGGPAKHVFQATEATEYIEFNAQLAQSWLEEKPHLAYETLCRLVRGHMGMYDRLLMHSSNDGAGRILTELQLEAIRFGKKGADGVHIELTVTDLATRTGMARETASREVSRLLTGGQLAKTKRGFLVKI